MFAGHILCFRLGVGEGVGHQSSTETVTGETELIDRVGEKTPPRGDGGVR